MKRRIKFDCQYKSAIIIQSAKNYFCNNGFKVVNELLCEIEFSRGQIIFNLFTINPLNWKSKIKISVVNRIVHLTIIVNTFGQEVTLQEDLFWLKFINNYKKTLLESKDYTRENFIMLDDTIKSNRLYIKWAILGALLFGLPATIFAYFTGMYYLIPVGSIVGLIFFMNYKIHKDEKFFEDEYFKILTEF